MAIPCEGKSLSFNRRKRPRIDGRRAVIMGKVTLALAVVTMVVSGGLNHGLLRAHGHEPAEANTGAHDQHGGTSSGTAVELEIVIGSEGYLVRRQGRPAEQRISLIAGRPAVFAVRNEDSVPHDFISALFTRIEVHFTGRATGIFRKEAAGFRLKPGDSLTLQFVAPMSEFSTMYDLIWCSHHREHSPQRRELLIVATEDKPSS